MGRLKAIDRTKNYQTQPLERDLVCSPDGALVIANCAGDMFNLTTATSAAGSSKVHFDLFNASTTHDIILCSLMAIPDGAVAVVGVVAVNLHLTRTTAVGTGGTAATAEGTTVGGTNIAANNGVSTLPTGVTARHNPAGGATAGAVLSVRSLFSEETNSGTYLDKDMLQGGPILIPKNSGIRVVQGSVASVGNLIFAASFSVVRNP